MNEAVRNNPEEFLKGYVLIEKLQKSSLEKPMKRKLEILDLQSERYGYKEITDRLFLGVDTVRTYIRNIYAIL